MTTTEHSYLSTGCYHGQHDYCRSSIGVVGAKTPGRCKFCEARCRCACHAEAPQTIDIGAGIARAFRVAPPVGPDIPVPLCPKCGDPVITSGCYPGDRRCGADRLECPACYDIAHDELDDREACDEHDVPPNAGGAS